MRFDRTGDTLMAAHDVLLFFRALASNPRAVGAIAPSGANLSSLITSEITAASGPVLELGAGTGVFTEALLARGVKESDLTLIEYGSDFMRLLQARFPNARVLWMDAAWMASHKLFAEPLGAVISGLPLLNFPSNKVAAILAAAFSNLRDGGAFYQFTYGMQCPISKRHLDELGLKANCMGRVLLNIPPASVYRITRSTPCSRG
jgi:phosphatidylethanolamine/phosphatidyl-N-methylethanolamine N-methyltransferase